jgi:TRAP transporter TAXI family solute receptor
MGKHWPGICSAALIFSEMVAAPSFGAPLKKALVLASGSPAGVYYPVAQAIAKAARSIGTELRVISTQGSRENLALLGSRKADLALVQSDAAFEAYHGSGPKAESIISIRTIASLYSEPVQILVRRPLYIHHIEDFRGKRISIGPKGSGTEANALAILAAAGITPSEVTLLHADLGDTLDLLRSEGLDIVFATSGVPQAAVALALRSRLGNLFELRPEICERLLSEHSFFVRVEIPQSTYEGQDEEVTTVGVNALLVGRSDVEDSVIYRLTALVATHPEIVRSYQKVLNVEQDREISIPLFAAASRYHEEHSLLRQQWRLLLVKWLPIAGAACVALLLGIFRRRVFLVLRRREMARFLVIFLFIYLVGSLSLYAAERRANENYSTVLRSLWAGIITMFSLAGKEQATPSGRMVAVAMLFLGYGGIAWATAKIAAFYVKRHVLGDILKMHRLSQHYVIMNWNDKAPGIIKQLQSGDFEERPIVVVSDDLGGATLPANVLLQKGRPTDEEVLRRARVSRARSVVVLAEPGGGIAADAKTVVIILTIRKICHEERGDHEHGKVRHVPIVAEVLDPQRIPLALYAGMSHEEHIEVVSSPELGQQLLAQTAVHPGLSRFYKKLLTFERHNSEIHSLKMERVSEGRTFDELLEVASGLRAAGTNVIPVGVGRGPDVFVNPSRREVETLKKGDMLFAICDGPEELKLLYEAIVER